MATSEPYPLGDAVKAATGFGVLEFACARAAASRRHDARLRAHRKQLNSLLGAFRALSYGTSTPASNKLH